MPEDMLRAFFGWFEEALTPRTVPVVALLGPLA